MYSAEQFASQVRKFHSRKVDEIIDRMMVAVRTKGCIRYTLEMNGFEHASIYAEEFKRRGFTTALKRRDGGWIVKIYFTDRAPHKVAKAKWLKSANQTATEDLLSTIHHLAHLMTEMEDTACPSEEPTSKEPEPQVKESTTPSKEPETKDSATPPKEVKTQYELQNDMPVMLRPRCEDHDMMDRSPGDHWCVCGYHKSTETDSVSPTQPKDDGQIAREPTQPPSLIEQLKAAARAGAPFRLRPE